MLILVGSLYFLRRGSSDTAKPKRGEIVESIYGLGTVVADSVYRVRVGLSLRIENLFLAGKENGIHGIRTWHGPR